MPEVQEQSAELELRASMRDNKGNKSKFGLQEPHDLPEADSLKGSKEVELAPEDPLMGTIEQDLLALQDALLD